MDEETTKDIDNSEAEINNTAAEEDTFENGTEITNEVALKKLREKLRKCEAERMEYLSGWQRSKADSINLKKETELTKSSFVQFAEKSLIEDLLPALSHFESAIRNKDTWETAPKEWRVGVEYIYRELLKVLEKRGVSVIDKTDVPFDPKEHEAVETVQTSTEAEDGYVSEVKENGFKLHDKVLKPARVTVYSLKK